MVEDSTQYPPVYHNNHNTNNNSNNNNHNNSNMKEEQYCERHFASDKKIISRSNTSSDASSCFCKASKSFSYPISDNKMVSRGEFQHTSSSTNRLLDTSIIVITRSSSNNNINNNKHHSDNNDLRQCCISDSNNNNNSNINKIININSITSNYICNRHSKNTRDNNNSTNNLHNNNTKKSSSFSPSNDWSLVKKSFSGRPLFSSRALPWSICWSWNVLMISLLCLLCLVQPISCSRSPAFSSRDGIWDYGATLDRDGAFVVEWSPMEDELFFRVTVKTKGYIGFGLSSKGRMDGADIVVG